VRGSVVRGGARVYRGIPLVGLAVLAGCWKLDAQALPDGPVQFAPAAGGPDGWVVDAIDLPIRCPDDQDARLYVVRPEALTGPSSFAMILHSGPFDYVTGADPGDPLSGEPFREPTRLGLDWSVERVFYLLGMVPDTDPGEDSDGALAAAFAARGVPMLIPTNCWGDWWHNYQVFAENDVVADGFYRNGLWAADFTQLAVRNPDFAANNGVDLGALESNGTFFLVGLGEGGRGVSELVATTALGAPPAGVLVDSPVDDLTRYWSNPDPAVYASTVAGLNRIFPGGAAQAAEKTLANSPTLPPKTALIYSSVDPSVPAGANDAAAARIAGFGLVRDVNLPQHVQTTSDAILAGEAVDFLVGTPPAP
jgi:hypothetical protein